MTRDDDMKAAQPYAIECMSISFGCGEEAVHEYAKIIADAIEAERKRVLHVSPFNTTWPKLVMFIHDRLLHVYGENFNVDYMMSLRNLASNCGNPEYWKREPPPDYVSVLMMIKVLLSSPDVRMPVTLIESVGELSKLVNRMLHEQQPRQKVCMCGHEKYLHHGGDFNCMGEKCGCHSFKWKVQ